MTARAMPADLGERILAQLAGHDSKRPARADDVAALVGGDEPAYWAAIEHLKGTSQINCAHIKRGTDPEPWLAIWPTGIPARMDTWHDLNARGHFNTHRSYTPQRLPQSIAARRAAQEIEMKQSPTATQVPDMPRARTQFALWDDGGLSIYDGDELMQIPPADVARLARLLGVPGAQLASGVAA